MLSKTVGVIKLLDLIYAVPNEYVFESLVTTLGFLYSKFVFPVAKQPLVGQGLLITEASVSLSTRNTYIKQKKTI